MLYLGVSLQVFGIVLILVGGFKAAQEMGAVERWWARTKGWMVGRGVALRNFVRRVVLRRGEPVVIEAKPAVVTATASGVGVVTEPDWASMDHDEQLALIRKRLDALRDLVDRNEERASGQLEEVDSKLAQLEASVDERFGGHDARDQTILGYELAGGAVSLLGTVIVLFA